MDAVGFRRARPDDGAAVAGVFGAARGEMSYLPVRHGAAEELEFFSGRVLPSSWVTVAEGDGTVVGFAAVKEGWLDHLYLSPAWQGRGIGGSLLARAMGDHPTGLSLWVFEANHRARAFYGRAGFVEVERTDGRGNEERVPDVRMRWAGARGNRGRSAQS
ncbi:MAG TPA: GNAT family N-acetyltransferase [Acidimicrobiales bacterium]